MFFLYEIYDRINTSLIRTKQASRSARSATTVVTEASVLCLDAWSDGTVEGEKQALSAALTLARHSEDSAEATTRASAL
jgi:ribonuclease D